MAVHQPELPGLLDDLLRPGAVPVVIPRDRADLLLREVVCHLANLLLLVGEREIDHVSQTPLIDQSVNDLVQGYPRRGQRTPPEGPDPRRPVRLRPVDRYARAPPTEGRTYPADHLPRRPQEIPHESHQRCDNSQGARGVWHRPVGGLHRGGGRGPGGVRLGPQDVGGVRQGRAADGF